MESPKEKAKQLVEKYRQQAAVGFNQGSIYPIECAKIVVDEIIRERENILLFFPKVSSNKIKYWHEVKNELNNM